MWPQRGDWMQVLSDASNSLPCQIIWCESLSGQQVFSIPPPRRGLEQRGFFPFLSQILRAESQSHNTERN